MTPDELRNLIASTETDRVEKTRSTSDTDKFREAICSFSNDMAGRCLPGHLLIGVDDKDPAFRMKATDDLLQQFASYRSDGQIMPLPVMNVAARPHPDGGGDIIVVEVRPHDLPPVRYKGRVCIRIGPRKDFATEAEERVLIERRSSRFPTHDATPCPEGSLDRLDLETFRQNYRNPVIAEAMHTLGYVNRFGRGIARAKRALNENGSPEPQFDYHTSHFLAIIPKHPLR
jgi:ATP-dependent DNA helicase RecG